MTIGFLAMAAPITWACWLLIWARTSALARYTALVVLVLAVVAAFLADTFALSRPKPVGLEFLQNAESANVLGAHMIEGEAIYLLLQLPGLSEPRYYALPWDQSKAQELMEAMEQAEREGTGVTMNLPFESSQDDREPVFHALPQPKLPDKPRPAAPQVYEVPA